MQRSAALGMIHAKICVLSDGTEMQRVQITVPKALQE
jgi:hypothetical protein